MKEGAEMSVEKEAAKFRVTRDGGGFTVREHHLNPSSDLPLRATQGWASLQKAKHGLREFLITGLPFSVGRSDPLTLLERTEPRAVMGLYRSWSEP